MKSASRRTLIGFAMYAALGTFTSTALGADGDGLQSTARSAAPQQAQPAHNQRLAALDQRDLQASTAATSRNEQRRAQLQWATGLNVPGNPAFGRVATR